MSRKDADGGVTVPARPEPASPDSTIQIGIDIGGTFTDVVVSEASGRIHATKVRTTTDDVMNGIRDGITEALRMSGRSGRDVRRFVHGTTIATNAILERKGASVILLATEGFSDVLEIGRLKRSRTYDMFMDPETPSFAAPRHQRYGIRERIDNKGRIVRPLIEDDVRRAVAEAELRHGVQAVAVCYLFSFLNSEHETRTQDVIAAIAPDLHVSLSSQIHPVFREYERTVITVLDAYVRPALASYPVALSSELSHLGIDCPIQIMESRGGVASLENVIERPVSLLLSGPAAGVVGGQAVGAESGVTNVITLDMGGTSCDVALVQQGRPLTTTEGRISTFPLAMPMVDVSTVGAGGGSVAWIDRGGGLRVGPLSAGSDPGPACYGRGGQDATVTDASVVLGYVNPGYFAGGRIPLDPEAAHHAVKSVGRALGLNDVAAALGIHRVINAAMADQLSLISVRRGYDPRDYALLVFGGAGPVHGALLADALDIAAVVVPPHPGVLSAYGLLVAPIEHDQMKTFVSSTATTDVAALNGTLADLAALGRDKMLRERVTMDQVEVRRSADMRYIGQSFELEVPIGFPMSSATVQSAVADFHAAHDRIYGHANPDRPVEFVNLRCVNVFPINGVGATPVARVTERSVKDATKEIRSAHFAEFPAGIDTAVLARDRLPAMVTINGPAIIEQPDTTTVVYPGHYCVVDDRDNLVIRRLVQSSVGHER